MVRTLALLKLKKRTQDVLTFARHVADSMTNNPYFPSPPRALASLRGHTEAATRAQAAVLSRTVGAAKKRDAHLADVKRALEEVRVFVQGIANGAPAEEAATIIVSAGLFVKGRIARSKQTLSARASKRSGFVRLTAAFAGKSALYSWAYSLDGETWSEGEPTMVAKNTIGPLVPGKTYFFRTCALKRKGKGDWTFPIAFLVT